MAVPKQPRRSPKRVGGGDCFLSVICRQCRPRCSVSARVDGGGRTGMLSAANSGRLHPRFAPRAGGRPSPTARPAAWVRDKIVAARRSRSGWRPGPGRPLGNGRRGGHPRPSATSEAPAAVSASSPASSSLAGGDPAALLRRWCTAHASSNTTHRGGGAAPRGDGAVLAQSALGALLRRSRPGDGLGGGHRTVLGVQGRRRRFGRAELPGCRWQPGRDRCAAHHGAGC